MLPYIKDLFFFSDDCKRERFLHNTYFIASVVHCNFFLHSNSPGRLYNALGEFTPNLWTQKAIHNFVSLQQCYVKEYSGLSLFDIYVSRDIM